MSAPGDQKTQRRTPANDNSDDRLCPVQNLRDLSACGHLERVTGTGSASHLPGGDTASDIAGRDVPHSAELSACESPAPATHTVTSSHRQKRQTAPTPNVPDKAKSGDRKSLEPVTSRGRKKHHKPLAIEICIPPNLPVQQVEIEVFAELLDSLGPAANDNEEAG